MSFLDTVSTGHVLQKGFLTTDVDTNELLNRIRTDLHPPQQQFFDNQKLLVYLLVMVLARQEPCAAWQLN